MPNHIVPSVVSRSFPFNTYQLSTVTSRPISLDRFEQWRINRSTESVATEWNVLCAGGEEDGTTEVINLDARRDQIDIGFRLFSFDLARIKRNQNSLHSNSFSLRVVHVTHALKVECVECESMGEEDHTLPPKWVGMGRYFQTREGFLIDPDAIFLFRLGYGALRRPTSRSSPSWQLWNVFHDFCSTHDEPIQCVVWNNVTYVRQFRHMYFRLSDALFDSSSGLYLSVGAADSNPSLQFQQTFILRAPDVDQFCIPNPSFQTLGDIDDVGNLDGGFQQHSIDFMASRLIAKSLTGTIFASLVGFIDRDQLRGYIADANSLETGWTKTIFQSRSLMKRLAKGIASLNARHVCRIHWEGNPHVVAWYNAYCGNGQDKDKYNNDEDHVRLINGDGVNESISIPGQVAKEMAQQSTDKVDIPGFQEGTQTSIPLVNVSVNGENFYIHYQKKKKYGEYDNPNYVFVSVLGEPRNFTKNGGGHPAGNSKNTALRNQLRSLCKLESNKGDLYFAAEQKSYFILEKNKDKDTWTPVGFKGAGSHELMCKHEHVGVKRDLVRAFENFIKLTTSNSELAAGAATSPAAGADATNTEANEVNDDDSVEFEDAQEGSAAAAAKGGTSYDSDSTDGEVIRFSNRLTTLDEKHQLVMKLKTLLVGQADKDDKTFLSEVKNLSDQLAKKGYNESNMVEQIKFILNQASSAKQTILNALGEIQSVDEPQNETLQEAAEALQKHVTKNHKELQTLLQQVQNLQQTNTTSETEKQELNRKIDEVISAYNTELSEGFRNIQNETNHEKLEALQAGIEQLKESLKYQTTAKEKLEKKSKEIQEEKSKLESWLKEFIQRFLEDLNSLQIMQNESGQNNFVIDLIKDNRKQEQVNKELDRIKEYINEILSHFSSKSLFQQQEGGSNSQLKTNLEDAKNTIQSVRDKIDRLNQTRE